MTNPKVLTGHRCPECYRLLQETNTGLICRRCGHTWEKIEEQDVKVGITDRSEEK